MVRGHRLWFHVATSAPAAPSDPDCSHGCRPFARANLRTALIASHLGFFAELSERALARAKAAPRLVKVDPLVGRGWLLEYQLGQEGGAGPCVAVNALVAGDAALEFSYRPPPAGAPREHYLHRAGRMLCLALERVAIESLPPVLSDQSEPQGAAREHVNVYLPGDCDRACVFCSVSLDRRRRLTELRRLPVVASLRSKIGAREQAEVEAKLRAAAPRAESVHIGWSGKDCIASPLFDDGLRLAHALGFRNMSIHTPGSRLLEPGFIEFLSAHSVTRVGLTAHAASEEVFDRVGGRSGAYRMFWTSFEALLAAGFEVGLEVPCVAETVDDLPEHLARLAAYPCPITCFYWYPSPDMNRHFTAIGVPFERAVAALEHARPRLSPGRVSVDGIPQCMAPPELVAHYGWRYGAHLAFLEFERIAACDPCPLRETCPGVAPIYGRSYPLPEARRLAALGRIGAG